MDSAHCTSAAAQPVRQLKSLQATRTPSTPCAAHTSNTAGQPTGRSTTSAPSPWCRAPEIDEDDARRRPADVHLVVEDVDATQLQIVVAMVLVDGSIPFSSYIIS